MLEERIINMKILKKTLVLLLLSGVAQAGILDVFENGVKNNPDRYVSVDLLGTWNHQGGMMNIPLAPLSIDHQLLHYNDRGMRGQLLIPIDDNTTAMIGGNFYTGDYSYDKGVVLNSYNGNSRGYGVEAGFRFYIHN
jgi:hypothetical protein